MMSDQELARYMRAQMLQAASRYWANYRKERMGFQRRMAHSLLLKAAGYRREERASGFQWDAA